VEKLELLIGGLVESQSHPGLFALLLEEPGSGRRLPLLIGEAEAQAIAIGLEQLDPPRPLTHDLLHSALLALGATLEEVRLTRVEADVFYAELGLRAADGQRFTLDARPSDAIALAVRASCPVFASPALLATAYAAPEALAPADSALSAYSRPELEAELTRLLAEQAYEQAARVRDALRRRPLAD